MTRNQASQRRRALLAAAAALGLGVAGTLAIWSDSEFAFVDLGTAGFAVESASSSEGPFAVHDGPQSALMLDFTFPSEGLVEGVSEDAEIWFRMISESRGKVRVLAPNIESNELDGYIEVSVTEGACDTPGVTLQQGLLEELSDSSEIITLPAGSASASGEVQGICIEATLGDTSQLPVGDYSTGSVEWQFLVTEEAE